MPKTPLVSNNINLDHYTDTSLNALDNRQNSRSRNVDDGNLPLPKELEKARPAARASSGGNDGCSTGWKTAGRVALAILSAGTSELLRLAWRGIMSCCSSSRPAPAHEPRVKIPSGGPSSIHAQPVADPGADAQNSVLVQALSNKGDMPQAHQEAVDSVLDELRGQYGSKFIPEGKSLRDIVKSVPTLIDPFAFRDIFIGVKSAKQAVSPEDLQNLIRRHFVPSLKKMLLADMANAEAQKLGGCGGLDMSYIVLNQLKAPGMNQRLAACGSMEDVQSLFRDMKLSKTIADIRATLDNVVRELQGIYGKEALPDKLEAVMKMGNDSDEDTMLRKLQNQYFQNGPRDIAWLNGYARDYLLPSAQHSFVSRAVEQAAHEQNVPLTARSVSALASAILADKGNKAAIDSAQSPEDLARIIKNMVSGVLSAQKAAVEKIYAQYADQVQPEQRPLLRSYIQGLSFAPANAEASRQAVEVMAGYMKNWKNFSGNEEEMQELNRVFKQSFARDLQTLEINPDDSTGYTDNIYNTLLADASRNDYVINGVAIGKENTTANLVGQIKTLLPNAQDQRFISKLINQRLQGNWVIMTSVGNLPDGSTVKDVPGTGSIPVMPAGKMDFQHDINVPATYEVTISDDKKTAVVTATMTQGLHYLDNNRFNGSIPDFGAVKYTYNFTLNLSAHEEGQGVTGFSAEQRFMTLEEAKAQQPS